jgi:hypothetical protein
MISDNRLNESSQVTVTVPVDLQISEDASGTEEKEEEEDKQDDDRLRTYAISNQVANKILVEELLENTDDKVWFLATQRHQISSVDESKSLMKQHFTVYRLFSASDNFELKLGTEYTLYTGYKILNNCNSAERIATGDSLALTIMWESALSLTTQSIGAMFALASLAM